MASHTVAEKSFIQHSEDPDNSMSLKGADSDIVHQSQERVIVTEEDNKIILRKTDKTILVILVWVYFLQILDKSVLGYGSLFGLQTDTRLVGNQYSMVGSMSNIAQLAWQPFSSILIVKVPPRILMPALVFGWGVAQTCMCACHNYQGLLAARFFLGLFEAGCLPLFSVLTSQWYRRAEQPLRVAAWYGTNGLATIVASSLSYGLAHIPSDVLKGWQIIFLFVGLVTVVTAPFVYWKLDNNVGDARFLTPYEREQAVERLRSNRNVIIGSGKFEMSHVYELMLEPKTWLWLSMSLLLNVGASVTNTFGPLLINGLGFDKYTSSLLNMPFGAVQLLVILATSWAAQKAKIKSAVLVCIIVPVIAGLAMLYALPHNSSNQPALLAGYYLLGFLFGGNPIIVTWIVGNTAGTTKKSVMMSLYNAGSSAGNIIGPLLFVSTDAPTYKPGLRAVLGIFVALAGVVLLQSANLVFLNKTQARKRVANGKKAEIVDHSMDAHYVQQQGTGEDGVFSEQDREEEERNAALFDLTDRKNDEFVYIY